MSNLKNWFGFALMGALGLSAAVGASSLGSEGRLIDFQQFGTEDSVNGSSDGLFNLFGFNAGFADNDGDIVVRVENELAPALTEVQEKEFVEGPVEYGSFGISSDTPFMFISADLGGSIFGNEGGSVSVTAVASSGEVQTIRNLIAGLFTGNDEIFSDPLVSLRFSASSFTPRDYDDGTFSLASATSGEGDGSRPPFLDFGEILEIDDITVETVPSEVPVPASALLLGSAILGAGAFARRRKRS